ncbi:MAG: FAD-dependent oxidoreductase, partial [Coriobacteriia bacterium]|nr:FAD-dependent oxidoreductase [Coriobacteriia bacterium]
EIETDCQAVFILRPAIAPDALVGGLALTDGNIAVGLDMSTSIPGVFAAGDCTGKPLQIAKAVGEGQIAGLSAEVFIS